MHYFNNLCFYFKSCVNITFYSILFSIKVDLFFLLYFYIFIYYLFFHTTNFFSKIEKHSTETQDSVDRIQQNIYWKTNITHILKYCENGRRLSSWDN